MDADRLLDMVLAVRMSCSDPDGRPGGVAHPVTVAVHDPDGSAALLQSADGRAALQRRAPGAVIELADGAGTDDAVAAVREHMARREDLPAAVAVGDSALLLVGATPADVRQVEAALGEETPAAVAPPRWQGKRLAGCVVVVTGGAQGFGKGIAEELAAEGACLWIADINDPPGLAFAAELSERFGSGVARFGHVDVTDADSVDCCLDDCVRAFGGVDMLISNAGVLRAGGLDELDEPSFDLVTAVNYKAYYLCARSAARIMRRQHELWNGHVMDIIQVNSKSGLEGSNRNFAYAGSKFGSLGLTQSFALELVTHGIKVNAICPGNYFDGPLWSDPEKGLFMQYLRAGKVPGAATIDDVRKAYMAKVPMNRGCLPADVARAVLYLHEQQYETGQALPVTGGQVMLN